MGYGCLCPLPPPKCTQSIMSAHRCTEWDGRWTGVLYNSFYASLIYYVIIDFFQDNAHKVLVRTLEFFSGAKN